MNRTSSIFAGRRKRPSGPTQNGFTQPNGVPADRSLSVGQNGFTLMELLIVIAIILILMLMAIPTFGTLKKRANSLSAINSVQKIFQAETQYESTYPANGYTCTLSALGGDPSAGPPTPAAAQLIQGDLTTGYKSGYIFKISNCTKVNVNGTDRITGYEITAIPQTLGKTGDRSYCADESGTIKFDPAGGANCTQPMQ